MKLQARNVRMQYVQARTNQRVEALAGISFDLLDGEFVSIVGPSGCGKTTFLTICAGLLRATSGSVLVDGRAVTGPGPDRGMVFQDPSLLPWRTVKGNVVYGLESQRVPKQEIDRRAAQFMRLVGLAGFEHAYPSELSGGMQQRANLARALCVDPTILLMDEPFASLDAQTRELMQAELLRIWRGAKKSVLFITHQIDEAVYLSDRVLVFSGRPGRILDDIRIDVPRPRPLKIKRDPRFLSYVDHVWGLIETETERSAPVVDAGEAQPVGSSLARVGAGAAHGLSLPEKDARSA